MTPTRDPHRRWPPAGGMALLLLIGAASPVPAVLAAEATAPRVQGVVSQVHDGDRLSIQPADGPAIEVRLRDMDAPELCQAGGDEARRALADLALNKPAVLQPSGRDGQGRVMGMVTVDDVNLNRRMVEEGHAWSIRTRWDQGPLVKQERMAKALGRGLHAAGGAEPPWQFRKRNGPCAVP